MPNRTIEDSIKIRQLIKEAVSQKILSISAIRRYCQEGGVKVSGPTINRILTGMGFVPSQSVDWRLRVENKKKE